MGNALYSCSKFSKTLTEHTGSWYCPLLPSPGLWQKVEHTMPSGPWAGIDLNVFFPSVFQSPSTSWSLVDTNFPPLSVGSGIQACVGIHNVHICARMCGCVCKCAKAGGRCQYRSPYNLLRQDPLENWLLLMNSRDSLCPLQHQDERCTSLCLKVHMGSAALQSLYL